MLTSADFLRSFMGEYVNAIQSGSTYDLAYKLALTNSAARFRVNCVKNVQELKLRLIISQGRIGGFPPELLSLVNTLGIPVAEDQITETFVSTLDGTLVNRGFDEASINSILLKHIEYLNKGYIFPRIACECDTPEQDPCRTITSMTANTSVSYALPEDVEAQLTDRIENLLNNTSGTSYDIENITTSDVQEIQDKIIDTLNILYSNGNIRTDPNSGRSAAIIQDFFSQMSTPDPNDPNKIMGFSGSDFAVLLTLIGGGANNGPISSFYSRLVNRVNATLGSLSSLVPGGSRSRSENTFQNVDYSANAVLFSTVLQFEEKVASCEGYSPKGEYGSLAGGSLTYTITCECKEEKEACSVALLANVVTKPVVYEVPYFYASGRAVAELPTAPDVQFIPYKDVDSLMLINLNTTAGYYTTQFIAITEKDQEYISNLASSRGVSTDAFFNFEGDPIVSYYEAFRIEHHPSSYIDFAMAETFTFQSNTDSFTRYRNREMFRDVDIITFSNAMSQEHFFTPNKKYYYIFRTIDVNNNISNPTKVFEVEMINNGGAIFPVIRVVDFLAPTKLPTSIEMRRLFMLNPAPRQVDILSTSTELQEELGIRSASDAVRSLKFSNETETAIWNKRFKIRFTSLSTGRMLDINVTPTTRIEDPASICGPYNPTAPPVTPDLPEITFDQA